LPIYTKVTFTSKYNETASIIHLDPKLFFARMPDRDKLIDEAEVIKCIHAQIKDEWLKILQRKKQFMSSEQFVVDYWKLSRTFKIQEVMNDVPIIPFIALSYIDQYPDSLCFSNVNTWTKHITQSQVENGEVVICDESPMHVEDNGFALSMFMWSEDWLILSEGLPEGHWVNKYIKHTDSIDVNVVYEINVNDHFYGIYPDAKIHLCDKYQIVVEGKSISIDEHAVGITSADYDDEFIIVIPKNSNGDEALAQISDYGDSNGNYIESQHDEDKCNLSNMVSVLRGEDPAITLTKVMMKGYVNDYSNLTDRMFMVQISNNNTEPSVIDAMSIMNTIMQATTVEQLKAAQKEILTGFAKSGLHFHEQENVILVERMVDDVLSNA
jgi:hypothetical protein